MKHDTKHMLLFAFIMTICFVGLCQTEFRGGTQIRGGAGTNLDDDTWLKKLGLVAEFKADHGVILNGTSVQSWTDMTGNGYNFTQYNTTNQPTFNASYSTNNFPAVVFTSTPCRMQNNSLAALFSGDSKPITVIALACSQTNAANPVLYGLGWSKATNSNCSYIALRPNIGTVTTKQVEIGSDTNAISVTRNLTSGLTTNNYAYVGFTYDGSNLRVCENLKIANSLSLTVLHTLDQSTLGCICKTNNQTGSFWYGSVSGLWVFTNGLSGTDWTNTVNTLNLTRTVY